MPVEFGKLFPQKEHLNVFGVAYALPNLFRFSLSLSKHENVVKPNGSLDVSGNNASLVPTLQNSDSNLNNFSCNPGPSDDLCDFGRDEWFVGPVFSLAHFPAPVFLIFSTIFKRSLRDCAPSPGSTTEIAAEPTSNPADLPSSSLLGT